MENMSGWEEGTVSNQDPFSGDHIPMKVIVSEGVTSFNGSDKSDFVDIFDFKPDRDAECNPADPDSHRFDQAGKVKGCCLAVRCRRCGQNDFAYLRVIQAGQEFANAKTVRVDALQWGKTAFKYMIQSFEFSGFFEGVKGLYILDNDKNRMITGGIPADDAENGGLRIGRVPFDNVPAGRTGRKTAAK
jgi:hypothetical protein